MQLRNHTPLAGQFLRRFLSVYLAFSVVGLAAMVVVEYQRQRSRVIDEMHALATTFAPVLGHAVWDFQDTAVTAIVHGIVQDPDIAEVQLPAVPGFAAREERSPDDGDPSADLRVEAPLTISGDSGANQRIGTLILSSSEKIIWRHVADGLVSSVTVTALVLLVGALALWRLVTSLLVDPLARFSASLQAEKVLVPGAARRVPRFAGREFAELRARFLLMLRQVSRAQTELRQAAALLEERVNERTLELSQVLEFNAAIIRNSPVPMGVYAANGDCVAANEAYANLAGATTEALLAQNFLTTAAWQKSPMQIILVTALAEHRPQHGEQRVRTSFGRDLYFEYRVLPTQLGGQDHLMVQLTDLTVRQRMEEELRQMAFQDALTGLPNRRLLLDRLDQAIRSSKRHGSHLAVVFIDLNRFKALNDTYGHDVGDKLLVIVAERLQTMVRGTDTVARLGGDEFVVLSTDLGHGADEALHNATLIADKIRVALGEPCLIAGVQHPCSASVGVKLFTGDENDADGILKQADAAMYADKKAGRPDSVAR